MDIEILGRNPLNQNV